MLVKHLALRGGMEEETGMADCCIRSEGSAKKISQEKRKTSCREVFATGAVNKCETWVGVGVPSSFCAVFFSLYRVTNLRR